MEVSGLNAIVTTKTAPPNQREYPALVNFNNECIFYGGGKDERNHLATVDFYRIASDDWSQGPNLSIARSSLSFCVQGETLYAMFGNTGSA